jgi:tRNA (guanine-N7-)-methyltransferase
MKPEDLKSPFNWKNRHVVIEDRVWYIPDHFNRFEEFNFPGWEDPTLFGNSNPVCVEYCSGNGAWIASKAVANPNLNWIAVEQKFERSRKIWSKIKNLKLSNLVVICGEAFKATKHYFQPTSVQEIYINFPDPWPKNRHAKHRIIQKSFVDEVWRILNPDGKMTIVTDDVDYSSEIIKVLNNHSQLISSFPDPFFTHELPDYGTSYFEDLWRQQGKTILYHQFLKKKVVSSQ